MKIEEFPSRIVLELTPRCNLSCPMCPRHYIKDTDGYMSEWLFKKLVNEIVAENPEAVVLPFWRGESCLHPEFHSFLNYALDQGLRIHLSTNGHFMGQEQMAVFYRCEFVTFSLHTVIGYRNARKFIDQKPSWSNTISQVSFVDSEADSRKFLADCTEDNYLMGFDAVRLYVEHTVGGEFGKSIMPAVADRSFCPKLTHTFVVGADGGYSRCNHLWQTQKDPGLTSASIREIWEGEVMNEIKSSYPDEHCGHCDQWSGHTSGEAWRKDASGRVEHMAYGIPNEL